jgi:hypothetical protein
MADTAMLTGPGDRGADASGGHVACHIGADEDRIVDGQGLSRLFICKCNHMDSCTVVIWFRYMELIRDTDGSYSADTEGTFRGVRGSGAQSCAPTTNTEGHP